ncbi:hypothetical protein EX30DRAFT_342997 [Ascodesmis nigricans]|uniref:Uncharacterized protein n=1 Tax=Ascodesmis nigricans TaxID=341454 RepID=A0A4S2MSA9_9PEZI|nr:hypothetical protein EX30DRAFT_342997 [Ascodesmis nigricans]
MSTPTFSLPSHPQMVHHKQQHVLPQLINTLPLPSGSLESNSEPPESEYHTLTPSNRNANLNTPSSSSLPFPPRCRILATLPHTPEFAGISPLALDLEFVDSNSDSHLYSDYDGDNEFDDENHDAAEDEDGGGGATGGLGAQNMMMPVWWRPPSSPEGLNPRPPRSGGWRSRDRGR